MGNFFDSIKQHFTYAIPKYMSVAQYLIFLINIIFYFVFVTRLFGASIILPYHNFIKALFQDLFVSGFLIYLTIFIVVFNVVCWIIKKLDKKTLYFSILVSRLNELFFLYLSIFLLYEVIFSNLYSSLLLLLRNIFYTCINFIYFCDVCKKMFDEKEFEEREIFYTRKREYLDYTLEKYEKKSIDEIEKRTALLNLYRITDEMYSKGVWLDEDEFRKLKYKEFQENKKSI